MTLRNMELVSSSVSFSSTSRHFPAFLKCYKIRKPSKSKFALNSIFTVLALARFFLSTVALCSINLLADGAEMGACSTNFFGVETVTQIIW